MKQLKRTAPRKANGQPTASKYEARYAVDVYIHTRAGMTKRQIAHALGVGWDAFNHWCEVEDAVQYAIKTAKELGETPGISAFREYVYKQLPQELRELWDKIDLWCEAENGFERVEAMLANHGVRVRQQLFMHAMVHCNFNASEALRMIGTSKSTLDDWVRNDPDFPKLIDELRWHRDNLFEGSLIKLVEKGNTLATLFANRTANRGRGYGEKLSVEHSMAGGGLDIAELDLPLDVRKTVLEAARKLREQKTIAMARPVMELAAAPEQKHGLELLEDDEPAADQS